MSKESVLAALNALPDAEFEHVVVVLNDIASRVPCEAHSGLGAATREHLGLPEPADVTVAIDGVAADSAVGWLG